MNVVRYADDSVFGFESEETARRFLTAMRRRHESAAIVGKWLNRVVQGYSTTTLYREICIGHWGVCAVRFVAFGDMH